jgi:hypothetical protein
MQKEKINWESFPHEEIKRLDDLAEITALIRFALTAYIRTPSKQSDRKAFAEEIHKLADSIKTWADKYEEAEP